MSVRACAFALLFVSCLSACGGGGGSGTSLSVTATSVSVTADTRADAPRAAVKGSLSQVPDREIYIYILHTDTALAGASFDIETERGGTLHMNFRDPDLLGPGIHRDTVSLSVCYDTDCRSQVSGSPKTIAVTYTVTGDPAPPPEPALGTTRPMPDGGVMPISSTHVLAYNVVDAEYSKALDAIVFVSSSPGPALHLYNPLTGTGRSMSLPEAPLHVSVSPDGLSANVALIGSVSHIDLSQVGPEAVPSRIFYTGGSSSDIVTDGFSRAHVFAGNLYTINSATGSAGRLPYSVYGGMKARMSPSGNAIYSTSTSLSPEDLYRFTDQNGVITSSRDSPYHGGGYDMCGNLWLSANGKRIYTACGSTYRASDFKSQDMTYMGRMESYGLAFYGLRIVSLEDSAQAGELALIEGIQRKEDCGVYYRECPSRLSLYENQGLTPIASYSIPDAMIDGEAQPRTALYVFYSADGSRKYVVAWRFPGTVHEVLTVIAP